MISQLRPLHRAIYKKRVGLNVHKDTFSFSVLHEMFLSHTPRVCVVKTAFSRNKPGLRQMTHVPLLAFLKNRLLEYKCFLFFVFNFFNFFNFLFFMQPKLNAN